VMTCMFYYLNGFDSRKEINLFNINATALFDIFP
jgi:hypothetical protein